MQIVAEHLKSSERLNFHWQMNESAIKSFWRSQEVEVERGRRRGVEEPPPAWKCVSKAAFLGGEQLRRGPRALTSQWEGRPSLPPPAAGALPPLTGCVDCLDSRG